jgi:hypothetical protein
MWFKNVSGRLGNMFYQRTKGGKIQCKSRLIPWKCKLNPSESQKKSREKFSLALKGKKFSNRQEMFDAINKAMKE